MTAFDPERYAQATVLFKRGMKASSVGVHRTLNRPPKGKGWVPCPNAPEGMFCRPDKVREKEQAEREGNAAYTRAAEMGLSRLR